jgi:hypothetical protein
MISFTDFEDKDGKVDWTAYRKAQIDAGENCEKCGSFIFLGVGYRVTCNACKELSEKSGEVAHKHFIRCPKCDHLENVHDDYYGLFEDGEHEVFCTLCDYKYTISTHVQFDFTSPPRLQEEKEVEEEDDEDGDVDETPETTP